MEDLTEFFSKEIIFVCIRFNTNIGICMYNHSPGDVHVKTCFGFFFWWRRGGGGAKGNVLQLCQRECVARCGRNFTTN